LPPKASGFFNLTLKYIVVSLTAMEIKRSALYLFFLSLFFLVFIYGNKAFGMAIIYPEPYPVFTNEQKAVIYYDEKTGMETLVASTTFRGEAKDFGWIIPTPSKPEVTAVKDDIFTALDALTQPKYDYPAPVMPLYSLSGLSVSERAVDTVKVLETKNVDVYTTTIVEANDKESLLKWLEENNYKVSKSMEFVLNDYVNKNYYFVLAKINTEALGAFVSGQLKEGHINPLKVTFATKNIIYPLRLTGAGSYQEAGRKIAAYSFEQGMEGWWIDYATYKPSSQPGASSEPVQVAPNTALSTDFSKHGTYSLKITGQNATSLKTTVSDLTPGTQYVLSAYVRSKNPVSGNALLRVEGGNLYLKSAPLSLRELADWKKLELPFAATSTYHELYLTVSDMSTEGEIYFDVIQLEEGSVSTEFTQEKLPNQGKYQNYYSNSATVLLYVIANHKKDVPGFTTAYAGWVKEDKLEKLSTLDSGEPWMNFTGRKYLTKLSRYMPYSQMNNDLVINNAENNNPVGTGEVYLQKPFRFLFVIILPIALEVALIVYFIKRRK